MIDSTYDERIGEKDDCHGNAERKLPALSERTRLAAAFSETGTAGLTHLAFLPQVPKAELPVRWDERRMRMTGACNL